MIIEAEEILKECGYTVEFTLANLSVDLTSEGLEKIFFKYIYNGEEFTYRYFFKPSDSTDTQAKGLADVVIQQLKTVG